MPYVWKFKFQFKQFELLAPTNEFNWIDTSSANEKEKENREGCNSIGRAKNRPEVPFEKDTCMNKHQILDIMGHFWALLSTVVPFLIQ